MFISFRAIVSEWIELSSLALSWGNDALSDKHVESIAKPVADGCVKFLLVFHSFRQLLSDYT